MLFHKERSISVIWTAAVLVAWAVVSSAPMAGAQPPQDAMIRGEVTESGTGLPVPNALVRVEAGALVNETYTNATGDYEMWLAAGSYNFIIVSGAHYLYFESFSIGSGETLWKNATIFPAPPRDANIRGFVNDTDTGDPVTWGRMVGVEQTQGYANFSWMDSVTGYYEMDVIAGDFQVFTDSVDGYWYWETSITLGSGTIYWLNLSLTPLPPANSTIWGYAYDASSGLPIENALIQLVINSTYQNYTYTNASGYYSFSVFSGNVEMMASAPGYTSDSASFSIGVDETIRQDFNLSALNAVVYGYVNDTSTGLGVPSAVVNANEMTGLFWNQTLTDGTGYYEMWLVAGDYWLDAWAPGYIGNSTTFSIAAYEVKRVDLGLTPVPPQNSTVRGYVNDSSTLLPISGAWVEIYNSTLGYWNGTSTDVTGYYEMNTPAGELQVQASATGYFSSWTIVTVADGASAWANLSLVPETSVVQGFVYDADTLAPIGGAWLSVTNSSGYWNSTTTDPSGYYNMNTIAGNLTMFASATGYATATREFQILESEVLNLDFYLEPLSARIVVNVTDYLTGSPIAGAWVSAWNASFQWWTGNSTDASGQTWLDVIVDSLTVRVEAGGYYPTEIPVVTQADQTIYLDVQLYPVLSETAMIRGYVNDTLGNTLEGARIYASGYAEWESETVSDLTGYYELWVVPAPLTILATASLHGPGWANISLSDGEVMWLNFTLDVDTTPPSVTNLTSLPDASISTNNPATINATLVEKYLQNAGIAIGMYAESYLDQDNYTLILQYVLQADGGPFPTLPVDLWPTGPDTYEMGAFWNGTTTGGWLGDGVSQEYLGAGYGDFGGTSYYVLFGRYDNSSTPSPIDTVAFFNDAGDLQFIIDMANGTFVDTSDPTAVFGAMKIMIFVNSTTLQLYGVAFDVDMWWPTASLVFN
ncbi:MAG: hypothetical protein GTO63_13130, partial [Anaerolineae bacterium]|nr:hypothetical protein [Anaerolineae bacterium]NIN95788.1 hypothetical protein [Anaerolineae bacterium]